MIKHPSHFFFRTRLLRHVWLIRFRDLFCFFFFFLVQVASRCVGGHSYSFLVKKGKSRPFSISLSLYRYSIWLSTIVLFFFWHKTDTHCVCVLYRLGTFGWTLSDVLLSLFLLVFWFFGFFRSISWRPSVYIIRQSCLLMLCTRPHARPGRRNSSEKINIATTYEIGAAPSFFFLLLFPRPRRLNKPVRVQLAAPKVTQHRRRCMSTISHPEID